MKTYVSFFIIPVLLFTMISCGLDDEVMGPDVEGAKSDIELANKALEDVLYGLINSDNIKDPRDIDFTVPFGLYTSAFTKDPDNLDANFGLALTSIFMMTQDQQVYNAFDEWEAYLETHSPFEAPLSGQNMSKLKIGFPTSLSFFSIPQKDIAETVIATHTMALQDAPILSKIQEILKNSLLPKLTFAQAALDVVDDNPDYTFAVTPKMQGDYNADMLEIDLTEIYALQISINILKVIVDIAVAYDVDFTHYDSLGMLNAFSQNSDFLKVRNSGQSLADAKTSLLSAVDKLEAGINFLRSESDSQDDDIIKLDPGSDAESVLDSILAHTNDVRDILTIGYTFMGDWDGNESTPEEELTINLGEYFTNPVTDLKALFPAYTVSVGRDTVDYDWYYTSGDSLVSATIDLAVEGYHYYYQNYSWDSYGYEYFWGDSSMAIPEFAQAVTAKITELKQIPDIEYMNVQLNWYGTQLPAGQHLIEETLFWSYQYREPERVMYVPIITWTADSFGQWILPDPTFGGILPDMTDSEFKRIFGISGEDWEKTVQF